jgi:kinesin family protein 11
MLYEAKEVIEEIHSSLDDQTQLLALSTQQQEKVMHNCSFSDALHCLLSAIDVIPCICIKIS